MNFKKTKVAVASGLMVASMVLAPLAAYAKENNGNAEQGFDSVDILKKINVADGVTIDKNVEFKVEQTENIGDGATKAPNQVGEKLADGEKKTYTYIVNSANKDRKSDKVEDYYYEETREMSFSDLNVPGEYTFWVAETGKDGSTPSADLTKNDEGYGWTEIDDTKYLLRVYVQNDANHTKKYTMVKYTIDKETGDYKASGDKTDTAVFNNTFTKKGGSEGGASSLEISKKVTAGSYVDANAGFTFDITFTEDTGSPAKVPSKITYEKVDTKGNKTENELGNVSAEVKIENAFALKADEKIVFTNLPAGIHYTATEHSFKNEKSTSNIATSNNLPGGSRNTKTTDKQLIGENVNSAEFTNTFKDITITGVVTHSTPFVIMVGALFVAVGGYVVLKKRIEE